MTVEQKSARLAGQLYEKAGELQRAVQVYGKGGHPPPGRGGAAAPGAAAPAAEAFLQAGDNERAAAAYEQAGDAVQAANLRGEVAFKADRTPEAAAFFVKGRDFLRAAELYESVGMLAEAAQAYEIGESWAAAGGVYMRAGHKERAAAAYEKGGELETAAKLYEELGDRLTRGRALRAGRLRLQERGGGGPEPASEQKAISPAPEGSPGRRELPGRDRAAGPSLHRDAGCRASPSSGSRRRSGDEPVSAANLDLYYWLARTHEASGDTPRPSASTRRSRPRTWASAT